MNPMLARFADDYLKADSDWLVQEEDAIFYRFWRLPIRISVQPAGANLKWKVHIDVTTEVQDAAKAESLCTHLNEFASGFSFAYSKESKSVVALIALSAPPEWDRLLFLLSENVRIAAWFTETIAVEIASTLEAKPAFGLGHIPARENPDVQIRYLEAMRERPEWVFDPTRDRYAPMTEIAQGFCQMMSVEAPTYVKSDSFGISSMSPAERSLMLYGGFYPDPLGGECWSTTLAIEDVNPALASQLTWFMYEEFDTSLLGSWRESNGSLRYTQNVLTASLRFLEHLESFVGHNVGELWSFSSQLMSAVWAIDAHGSANAAHSLQELGELADQCLAPITAELTRALEVIPTQQEGADPSLLWFDSQEIVLMMGWFNPIGPTLETYGIAQDAQTSREYLVRQMRHPFSPEYEVLALVNDRQSIFEPLRNSLNARLHSLPMFTTTFFAPEGLRQQVDEIFRERILSLAAEHGEDLGFQARVTASTLNDPWASATLSETDLPQEFDVALDPYVSWLTQVSAVSHVRANLFHFPDAWDGAINFLSSNIGRSGPMSMVYNRRIGVTKPQ